MGDILRFRARNADVRRQSAASLASIDDREVLPAVRDEKINWMALVVLAFVVASACVMFAGVVQWERWITALVLPRIGV